MKNHVKSYQLWEQDLPKFRDPAWVKDEHVYFEMASEGIEDVIGIPVEFDEIEYRGPGEDIRVVKYKIEGYDERLEITHNLHKDGTPGKPWTRIELGAKIGETLGRFAIWGIDDLDDFDDEESREQFIDTTIREEAMSYGEDIGNVLLQAMKEAKRE